MIKFSQKKFDFSFKTNSIFLKNSIFYKNSIFPLKKFNCFRICSLFLKIFSFFEFFEFLNFFQFLVKINSLNFHAPCINVKQEKTKRSLNPMSVQEKFASNAENRQRRKSRKETL